MSASVKGRSLSLEGPKGSQPSPKTRPEAPRHRVASPRGKALADTSTGGVVLRGKAGADDGGSSGDQTSAESSAFASLHERHLTLQQEHASLLQAHAALQAKHRDSVGSCLALLDQIKELQGRLDLNEQSLSSARAPEPSSKGGAAVRCTPRTMPGGGTSTHSAPPHKQAGAVAGTDGRREERRGELGEEAWAPSRAPDCKSLSSTMTPTGMVAGFGSRGAVVGGTSARDGHGAPAAAGAGAGGAGGSRAASSMLVNGRGPLNSGRATGAAAEAPS
ncbi:hypothetical protein Ctob_013473, partial [Chrysochromulina tobinii]